MLNNDISVNITTLENILQKRQKIGVEELSQEDVDLLFDNFRDAQIKICEFIYYSNSKKPIGHNITWGTDIKTNCYTTGSLISIPLSLHNRKILHHSYVLLTDIIFMYLRGVITTITKPTNCENLNWIDANKPCIEYLTYTYVMSTIVKDANTEVKYLDVHEEDISDDHTTFHLMIEHHNINILKTVWTELVKNYKSQ